MTTHQPQCDPDLFTSAQADILFALRKIDRNKKGFVLVTDENGCLLGTLTDGDIRRAFIAGAAVTDTLASYYTRECRYLRAEDGVLAAVDLFKNESIRFLPIVDEQRRVVNIITKDQLHSLLLLDIRADLYYDFRSLDENIVNHEIYKRPWGYYKTTVMNDYCQSKIICVFPGAKLSLQSHDHREEHWIITHGQGLVQIGDSVLDARCGSYFFIPKGCRHRLTNTDPEQTLVVTEVQIGDYFGEDDIHRYEDIYGRV